MWSDLSNITQLVNGSQDSNSGLKWHICKIGFKIPWGGGINEHRGGGIGHRINCFAASEGSSVHSEECWEFSMWTLKRESSPGPDSDAGALSAVWICPCYMVLLWRQAPASSICRLLGDPSRRLVRRLKFELEKDYDCKQRIFSLTFGQSLRGFL